MNSPYPRQQVHRSPLSRPGRARVVAEWRLRVLRSSTGPIRARYPRYALAFVAVGLAWASREYLLPEVGDRSPFLVFGLAVLVTALVGGFGPGILAVSLSSVVAVYCYLPPHLALAVHEPFDGVGLGVFALEGLVAAIAGGMVRRKVGREEPIHHPTRRLAWFLQRAEVIRGQPMVGPERLVTPERLVEDLTEREREVARLLAFGLGNSEIAATLFVSRNTVKTHLKHIYEKLAVRTRTEAVARCIEFDLLRGAPGEDESRAAHADDAVDPSSRPEDQAA